MRLSFSDRGGGEILESWMRRVVSMAFIDIYIILRVVFMPSLFGKSRYVFGEYLKDCGDGLLYGAWFLLR